MVCDNLRQSSNLNKRWERPKVGWLKTNIDDAIRKEMYRVGLGLVARKNDGDVVWAAAKPMQGFAIFFIC